ncbi:MAG: hypothetical protein OHK0023_16150 [Anaerolineae bacterium]
MLTKPVLSLMMVIGVLLVLVSACGTPPEPTPTPVPPTATPTATQTPLPTPTPTRAPITSEIDPQQRATIRLFHAGNGAPTVDMLLDQTAVANRVAFGTFSASLPINPGSYRLQLMEGGTNNEVAAVDVVLKAKETVIYVLRGKGDGYEILRYTEDRSPVPIAQSRVAAINAVEGEVALGVFLSNVSIGATTSGGQGTPSRAVNQGEALLQFREGSAIYFEQQVVLRPRIAYTYVLYTDLNGNPRLSEADIPTQREAFVKLANAHIDARAVDIYLDDALLVESLPRGISTDYLTIAAGNYTVTVRETGLTLEASPLLVRNVQLNADERGVIAFWTAPEEEGAFQYELNFYRESLEPMPADQARLIIVNLSRLKLPIQLFDPSRPVGGVVNFGQASLPIPMPARRFTFAFNTVERGAGRIIESNENVQLEAGKQYMYIVTGIPNVEPMIAVSDLKQLLAALPTATLISPVKVRFIHLMSDVPKVDLEVGGEVLFNDVEYAQSTRVLEIESQVRPVRVLDSATGAVLAEDSLAFAPNGDVAIAIFGKPDQPLFAQTLDRNRPTSSSALVRVMHGVSNLGNLSFESPVRQANPSGIRLAPNQPTPTPIFRTVKHLNEVFYGQFSRVIALRGAAFTFVARDLLSGEIVAQIEEAVLENGNRYDVLIVPDVLNGGNQIVINKIEE